MTKEELIHITLRQLIESFKTSPENFRLDDAELGQPTGLFPGPTIVWQFKVKLKEDTYIQDPLNASRTIIVTYNKVAKQISCAIYFREVNEKSNHITPDTQATFQCSEIPILNRTYRQFQKIRQLLVKQRREKEFIDYMRKLNNIFPSVHEEDIFK
jgi:hypothetical protein